MNVADTQVQQYDTCGVSLDNAKWHADVDNPDITPIACKIYHTQYPYQRIHVQPKKYALIDMNTYDKYI